jgi:hypothetical protein
MATFEEAQRCPRCDKPGRDQGGRPGRRRGVKVHTIVCETELCPWYNTTWLIQVNEDGTIPDAYSQVGEKQFHKVSPETETRINEALERQLKAEQSGQGEIRNPYSQ